MENFQHCGITPFLQSKDAFGRGRYSEAEIYGQKARKKVWTAIIVGSIITVIAVTIGGVVIYLRVANSDV